MGMKGRNDVGSCRVRVGSATGGGFSDDLQVSRIERKSHDRNDDAQPMNRSLKGETATVKYSGKSCESSRVVNSSARAASVLCADVKRSIADCNIGHDKQFVEGVYRNPKRERPLLGSSHDSSEISNKFVDPEAFFCGSKGDFLSYDDERVKKLAKMDPSLENASTSLRQRNLICIDRHSDDHETASPSGDIKGRESSPQPALSSSPSAINMLPSCRSIDEFKRVSKISEGTYGVVFKAQDKKTGGFVAIKKVKMEREKEGFPITSLREINILLSMDHPSIVVVKGIAVDKDFEGVYMVMEHIEQDLAGLLASYKGSFSESEVKFMMLQLLEGIEYVHSKWVLHRDLKPSNLLVDSQGMLKICDFGLARQFGSPLKAYTHKVVSLCYRDPVLLLGPCKYSTAVDMWSLGCIMAELLSKVPLFEGCGELDQLKKIVAILGSPDETLLKDKLSGVQFNFLKRPSKSTLRERFPPTSFTGKTPLSEKGFDLLSRLLTYDPNERISAEDAVRHDWFREDPLPKPLTLSSCKAHCRMG